jgi:hypothetical protein
VEPATLKGSSSRFGIFKEAGHHTVAVHSDLSHRAAIGRHVVHLFIDYAHPVSQNVALSLAGQQSSLLCNGERVPLCVPRADRVGAIRLGQPVDMDEAEVELLQDLGWWSGIVIRLCENCEVMVHACDAFVRFLSYS